MIEGIKQWVKGLRKMDGELKQFAEWAKHFDKSKFEEAIRKHVDETLFPSDLRKRFAENSWLIVAGRLTLYQLDVLRGVDSSDNEKFNELTEMVVEGLWFRGHRSLIPCK